MSPASYPISALSSFGSIVPTFSPSLERALHRALELANDEDAAYSNTEHLLLALLEDESALSALKACNCDIPLLANRLNTYLLDYPKEPRQPIKIETTPKIGSTLNRIWSSLKSSTKQSTEIESAPIELETSKPTEAFQRVIQRAVIHVQSSGRNEVTGANVLVALTAEKDMFAAELLAENEVTRYDLVNYISHGILKSASKAKEIADKINKSSEEAPTFKPIRGRLRYRQTRASSKIKERKAPAVDRCAKLQQLCATRSNEQPELKEIVDRYSGALKKLRADRGAYSLFIAGLEIETFLRIKSEAPKDSERNPPLDADILIGAQSLIIAHAGLVSLFPDVQSAAKELDRYRELTESIDALRDRVLDPILDQLSSSTGIFDEDTQNITKEIQHIEAQADSGSLSTRGAISAKHSWLRGALSSIGQYVLKQFEGVTKIARDAAVKETVSQAVKNPDQLAGAIIAFLQSAKPQLLMLAENLRGAFGWIVSLLSHLGV